MSANSTANTTWELKFKDSLTSGVSGVQDIVDSTEKSFKKLNQEVQQSGDKMVSSVNRSNKALGMMAVQAGAQAITDLGRPLLEGAEGTYKLDAALHELKGITGVTDLALSDIKKRARETAVEFGGSASESINSYTVLLSKLDAKIAQNPEALGKMGTSVALLGETMRGDLVGATNSAASVMNQFGVDLSDPTAAAEEMDVMLNNLAASAKVGSQDVPVVARAIDEVGASAKNANVSFIETNAALQVLGKFGKEGAEGGIALRNVLSTMGKKEFLPKEVLQQLQAAGVNVDVLADKSKPLADRLTELQKLKGKDNVLGAMFGAENTIAITGLLQNIDLLKQYTNDIANDQTALADMAAEMGKSYQEQKDRITSYFEDVKLSIYGATGAMLPFIDIGLQGVLGIIGIAPGIMATAEMFTLLKESTILQSAATKIATASQWALNLAMSMNPMQWVIIGVMALVGVIALCWNKFEGFRNVLFKGWEMLKLFGTTIKEYVIDRLKGMLSGITGIGSALMHFFKGEWSEAWEAGKKGVADLTGVTAGVNAVDRLRKGMPKAMAEGQKASDDYTAAGKKKKEDSAIDLNKKPVTAVLDPKGLDLKTANDTTKGTKTGSGLSTGESSGSVAKSINMVLNITNNFGISNSQDVRKTADEFVGLINDRLRDSIIQIG